MSGPLDDTARVRLIAASLRECGQAADFDAIAAQFRFETGRELPETWKREPPAWLRRLELARDEKRNEAAARRIG